MHDNKSVLLARVSGMVSMKMKDCCYNNNGIDVIIKVNAYFPEASQESSSFNNNSM